MTDSPTFDPSDIFYDLSDLTRMLDAIRLVMSEMEFRDANGRRNEDLERAYAMVKIAGREAERLSDTTRIFDGPATWGPVQSEVRR
jgi:hypothetical protein